MVPNVFASLFYLVCFISFALSLMLVKKTEKKMNIMVWTCVVAMAICGYQSFVAAIFSLVKIPVNIVSLGVMNLLASAYFWFRYIKKNEKQSYYFDKINILGFGILCVLLYLFMSLTYTLEFAPQYLAIDASVHFDGAVTLQNYEAVHGMFFAKLQYGIFIELFGAFISPAVYYKLFVICDLLMLLFAWMMFYSLIQKYAKDNFLKLAAIVVTVVYGVGYPMNSTLFGFTYLGTAITIVTYLLIVFDWFMDEEFNENYSIILLSLGCLSLFESYMLFVPVVFFGLLFAIFYKQAKKKKLVSVETIKYGLSIFLMPSIIGLVFTYGGIFVNTGDFTVSDAISNEGGIYRDFYSNFAILIPFALFAMHKSIKEKQNKLVMWYLPLMVLFLIGLLLMALQGSASSYYYYKNYYILWLLMFELLFIAISSFTKEMRVFLLCGFTTWVIILFAYIFNWETYLQSKTSQFVVSNKTGTYHEIFGFNRDAINVPHYSSDKLHLYRYAIENLQEEGDVLAIASTWEDWYWFTAISNQTLHADYAYWNYGAELFFERMNAEAEYTIVLYDAPIFMEHPEVFWSYETVYETPVGCIIKVK